MNCFNIRELQGVLKRKFFTDLVNTTDHRDFLNQSIIGLRFKSNNQLSITPDVESFFNLGLTNVAKTKTNSFVNSYTTSYYPTTLYFFTLSNLDLNNSLYLIINNLYFMITSINFNSLYPLFSPISILRNTLVVNFSYPTISLPFFNKSISSQEIKSKKVFYTTENINTNLNLDSVNNTFLETSNNVRFTRFNNPLISYDYKCGHYLGI
jgi:hypothetical protein